MAEKLIKQVLVADRYVENPNEFVLRLYESGVFGRKRLIKLFYNKSSNISDTDSAKQKEYTVSDYPDFSDDDFIFWFIKEHTEDLVSQKDWRVKSKVIILKNSTIYYDYKPINDTDKKFVSFMSKYENVGGYNYPHFEILQDPYDYENWEKNKVPFKRSFGYKRYYLNNGASFFLNWTYNSFSQGGEKYSDNWGREMDPEDIGLESNLGDMKKVISVIYPPSNSSVSKSFQLSPSGELIDAQINSTTKEWNGRYSDKQIIEEIIKAWKVKDNIDLKICEQDVKREFRESDCQIIPFKDPLSDKTQPVSEPISGSQSLVNTPPKTFVFDVSKPGIFLNDKFGELTIIEEEETKQIEQYYQNDLYNDYLDEEYGETQFAGEEEAGLSLEEIIKQNEISDGQLDSDANGGVVGSPADIKPYASFDELINLAGKCARELGKNNRVNSENMKKNYTEGIHGLCPQGTQAVLYALTGIKSLGQIPGNADSFSFKSVPTNGKYSSFSTTGYFSEKAKIKQIDGKWKGTYLDSPSQWQIGDVIAVGYKTKKYGHIQVWTGYCWMSDFKQNKIQQSSNLDTDSVALWRLNDKGVEAVRKQRGKSV